MSFVWGDDNVAFLRDRYKAMSASHCYHGMEYSENQTIIPTYGTDLTKDAAACRDTRAKTAQVLRLTNV
jgi:L-2-hydroxyglutarate oxidase LhgO